MKDWATLTAFASANSSWNKAAAAAEDIRPSLFTTWHFQHELVVKIQPCWRLIPRRRNPLVFSWSVKLIFTTKWALLSHDHEIIHSWSCEKRKFSSKTSEHSLQDTDIHVMINPSNMLLYFPRENAVAKRAVNTTNLKESIYSIWSPRGRKAIYMCILQIDSYQQEGFHLYHSEIFAFS